MTPQAWSLFQNLTSSTIWVFMGQYLGTLFITGALEVLEHFYSSVRLF